jgi:tubulin polyglutamylase TTLL6/13
MTSDDEEKSSKLKIVKAPPKKKEKLYVWVTNTKYNVVKRVSKWLSFKVTQDEKIDWDIAWYDTGVTPDKVIKLMDYQRINHYPGMYALARKNFLASNIDKMVKVYGSEYKFHPPTWLLP